MYIYIHYIDIHKSMTQYIMYVLLEDSPIGVILILPKVWRRSTPMARVARAGWMGPSSQQNWPQFLALQKEMWVASKMFKTPRWCSFSILLVYLEKMKLPRRCHLSTQLFQLASKYWSDTLNGKMIGRSNSYYGVKSTSLKRPPKAQGVCKSPQIFRNTKSIPSKTPCIRYACIYTYIYICIHIYIYACVCIYE